VLGLRIQALLLVRRLNSLRASPAYNANRGIRGAGQVGKVLGERWKALSEKQRQPYEAKAAADKKRYENEKAAYQVCLS
jgi:hypothetical protein